MSRERDDIINIVASYKENNVLRKMEIYNKKRMIIYVKSIKLFNSNYLWDINKNFFTLKRSLL